VENRERFAGVLILALTASSACSLLVSTAGLAGSEALPDGATEGGPRPGSCAPDASCREAGADLPLTGDGQDGSLAPTRDQTLNDISQQVLGTLRNGVDVKGTDGFRPSQYVLLHQTRGDGAGRYEFAIIASVDMGKNKVVLAQDLVNPFTSAGDNRAQMIVVPRFTDVTIPSGVTVTAPAWDGARGGILVFKASGTISVSGTIDMSGRGFRGVSHASTCPYQCGGAARAASASSGESASGPALESSTRNGSGGGGGQHGGDCSFGGGGGHATEGETGTDGESRCTATPPRGGVGGGGVGAPDLSKAVFFGGAGGEAGADEDGAYPGAGGNGGGIVWIDAADLRVIGAIRADGGKGGDGQNLAACGGGGSGMGGGGGGAGGAIRIRVTTSATIGANAVTASGGDPGKCAGKSGRGGRSGAGRIGIAGAFTGSSSPNADPH